MSDTWSRLDSGMGQLIGRSIPRPFVGLVTTTEHIQGRITEEDIGWARSKRGSGGAGPWNFLGKLGAVRTLLVASETRSVRAAT